MKIKVGDRYQSDQFTGTVIATNRNDPLYPVVFLQDDGIVHFFCPDGKYVAIDDTQHDKDLKPLPREFWINVYPESSPFSYSSKEDADKNAGSGRVACVKAVEGEFH